jgi:hypothetical protein
VSRRRVGRLLGLDAGEAELLLELARARLGRRGYLLRRTAFAVATAPLLRHAIPIRLRVRAIRPFLFVLLPSPSENLFYLLPGARRAVGSGR